MADSKVRVLDAASFLKTLDSTNGRDKLGKLIQYTARLSAWYLSKINPEDKSAIVKVTGVQKGVATARKLTRLLKWWPLLIKLWDLISNPKKLISLSVPEHLRSVANLGMANYFLWDNISYAINLGLYKGDNVKISKWSMYGWFLGLVFTILADTYELLPHIKATISASTPSNTETQPKTNWNKALLNYSKNLSDLCISAKGTNLVDFSEGFLGVCGIVASLVGFYELWPTS